MRKKKSAIMSQSYRKNTFLIHLVLIAIEGLFWLFTMINAISFGMNFDSLLTFPSVLVFLKQRLL